MECFGKYMGWGERVGKMGVREEVGCGRNGAVQKAVPQMCEGRKECKEDEAVCGAIELSIYLEFVNT